MTDAPANPLAFLLTWSCRGTWLHGDARGWMDQSHNAWGVPWPRPDAFVSGLASSQAATSTLLLTPDMRSIVDSAIADHCSLRAWKLHALNARTNHVHVVVGSSKSAEVTMQELKTWSTRRFRERGYISTDQPIWTRHGSTKYLWEPASVAEAVRYVQDGR